MDENLHEEVAGLLRQSGHDAVSVFDQQLRGAEDIDLAAVCQREGRAIVTQDLDFANILVFPPEQYAGILVLRLHNTVRAAVVSAVTRLLPLLSTESLSGCLWIVDDTGVRIHIRSSS